ncbi:MAG: HEAT repeat domain-containing protein [Gemmataceae bacterium]|nr:HEAT repeat domain-containing protein [Gemmata sp.]MDW8199284.1 HEAT repeat domain-containing protein [Gemmataceae bacterium]
MRLLSLISLFAIVWGITLWLVRPNTAEAAPPPAPPEPFIPNQTPAKPEPFPLRLVDQGSFDPQLKGLLLPEGFRAEIVIQEPDTINPVGMTFDPEGNLYVLEWRPDPVVGERWFEVKETFRYRDGTTKQVATMKKFTTDWIKFFRYDPGTGRFAKPQIIIAEELPSSILWHEGYLYVTGRGTVRRWKQSRPGGPWDIRETIAQGFCGFHHHQVSGLTLGNDGLLYITSGDDDNFVEGSDGSRATVLRTGAVFRCRPDGSRMETYSIGYRNPYRDIAFDDKFNAFHADNDQEDGSKFQGCRIMHVAEGSDFGWRLALGARCCRTDFVRGAVAGERPGKVPPMIKTGRGSPAGLLIYNDTRLPEHYRGLLYYPDVFRKLVRAYRVAPQGSTFAITHEFEFMKSDDPLFRPCQMIVGPDGAIYVCDWRTDSGGAGKLSGDGIHGRIYRLTWVGTKDHPARPRRGMDSWAKIRRQSDDELIATLAYPDFTDQVEARKELVRRGPTARDRVLKKFISGTLEPHARLVAMGVLAAHWNAEVENLFRLLIHDESPDVRRFAVEMLGYHGTPRDERILQTLEKALTDQEPAVRRVAALALGRMGGADTGDVLLNALKREKNPDIYLKDAYVRGLERLGRTGIAAILDLARSGTDPDKDLAVEIFLMLRTAHGAEALPELLLHPHVTIEQREQLVRSYTNYQTDPPISLEPLANYLAKRPNEPVSVLLAAVDVFAASGATLAPSAVRILLDLLQRPEEATRIAALIAIEELRISEASPQVLEIIEDTKRTQVERVAAAKALRALGEKKAIEPIKTILVGGHPAVLKAELLRTLATLDVVAARAAAEKALDQPDPTFLAEAVAVLAATKPGARLIAERFLANRLPPEFFPQVNEALNKFADDPAFAKLRTDVLRGRLLLSLEPSQVDKIRTEVVQKGNPSRGKELYLNTKLLACATCHRMEGVGGAVGPDLTRLWDTMSVEKILEAIVDPSKEIKEGFQTYRLVTVEGQVYTGLKIRDDAKEVVIREATGRDVRVAKEDIESLAPSKLSLMPDNVVAQLRYEQFLDLLAFLKSRSEQESLRGLVLEAMVAGPRPWEESPSPPELTPESWKLVTAEANGQFNLPTIVEKAENAAIYLRTHIHSPHKQSVRLTVQTSLPWKAWVGRAAVAGKSADSLSVELNEGWNVLVVRITPSASAGSVGLRVAGENLRIAAQPDRP